MIFIIAWIAKPVAEYIVQRYFSEATNDQPTVDRVEVSDQEVWRGGSTVLLARATDKDGDRLTYEWSWKPEEAAKIEYPNPASKDVVKLITMREGNHDAVQVVVVAEDKLQTKSTPYTQEIRIISPENISPTVDMLEVKPDDTVPLGTKVEMKAIVRDADCNQVRCRWVIEGDVKHQVDYHNSCRAILETEGLDRPRAIEIKVEADDGRGGKGEYKRTIHVIPKPRPIRLPSPAASPSPTPMTIVTPKSLP